MMSAGSLRLEGKSQNYLPALLGIFLSRPLAFSTAPHPFKQMKDPTMLKCKIRANLGFTFSDCVCVPVMLSSSSE